MKDEWAGGGIILPLVGSPRRLFAIEMGYGLVLKRRVIEYDPVLTGTAAPARG